jgi:hypothetical protein
MPYKYRAFITNYEQSLRYGYLRADGSDFHQVIF